MTIVGLDFCPPSDAAEWVPLYHWTSPPHPSVAPYSDWYGFSPGIYPRHRCSLWIYPPTHRLYTRITPFALFIYEDSNHINLGMGHGINTGTHMCICGSACHSCFLALTDTTNCFPLTGSGGRSKKYHSIDSPVIKTGCTHIWPDSGYVHYLHGWVSVFV